VTGYSMLLVEEKGQSRSEATGHQTGDWKLASENEI